MPHDRPPEHTQVFRIGAPSPVAIVTKWEYHIEKYIVFRCVLWPGRPG